MAYIRVSKVGGRDDDLLSPELQRHAIDQLAAREGITIAEEFQDLDKSGRDFTKRSVAKIIQGIRDGKWKYVVLWKWSRWGRNMRESQIHLGLVEDAGGIVRAATEDFDPATTMGRFTRDQMLLIAQLQSDMIGDGWREVHAKRRRDKLPHGGGPRFGYTYSKRNGYEIKEDEALLLKNAYERYVAGEAHRAIALEWTAAGLKTTRGTPWTRVKLALTMDTGFAAGLIRERSDSAKKRGKTRAIWAFDAWREGKHRPIISIELWEAYVARRKAQAEMPPRVRTAPLALSGLLVCGDPSCGKPMQAHYGGRRNYLRWVCNTARDEKTHPSNIISNPRAMGLIMGWLAKNAEGSLDVTGEARRIEAGRRAKGEAEAYAATIAALTVKRGRLADLYTDGDIGREDYREQKVRIEAELDRAVTGRAAALARERASGGFVREFRTLAEEWSRLAPADQREALLQVVKRIVVEPGLFSPEKLRFEVVWE
ncbi:recombinase family protein [Dactylosporangium darangshiense]|uniref:Recombinase domain-containing protein n=1 Tax=Dactylosporangium darangshiense TaxID=579108 RepID=A0ABP8DV72_9ACTN